MHSAMIVTLCSLGGLMLGWGLRGLYIQHLVKREYENFNKTHYQEPGE